eukprot:m.340185 g.340185  ORF g.340185 m.340185 type:complete len:350 (+) comp19171_c0_seq1:151-1200(+)
MLLLYLCLLVVFQSMLDTAWNSILAYTRVNLAHVVAATSVPVLCLMPYSFFLMATRQEQYVDAGAGIILSGALRAFLLAFLTKSYDVGSETSLVTSVRGMFMAFVIALGSYLVYESDIYIGTVGVISSIIAGLGCLIVSVSLGLRVKHTCDTENDKDDLDDSDLFDKPGKIPVNRPVFAVNPFAKVAKQVQSKPVDFAPSKECSMARVTVAALSSVTGILTGGLALVDSVAITQHVDGIGIMGYYSASMIVTLCLGWFLIPIFGYTWAECWQLHPVFVCVCAVLVASNFLVAQYLIQEASIGFFCDSLLLSVSASCVVGWRFGEPTRKIKIIGVVLVLIGIAVSLSNGI